MNIQGKKVAARVAAVVAVVAGSSVVACTQTEAEPNPGPIGAGGTSVLPMGGSAGGSAMAGTNPGGGSGGATGGGSKVMGDPCAMTMECSAGLQCLMSACSCPAYAPTFCEADAKCSSPMKDPDHCGNCDTKCGEKSACNAGACTPDLTTVAEVPDCGTLKLVIGGTTIYALSTMPGTLSSIPAAGGAPVEIATGLTGATAFAVDATNAYVAAGMSIQRVPLAGGAAAAVVTETAPIHDVAVEGTTLYYATGKDIKTVMASAAAGTGMAKAIGIDEGEPQGVAISGGFILYSSNLAMNVEVCDSTMECHTDNIMPGAGHIKIGASQGGLIFGHRSVQTDGTNVYWVNNGMQGAPFKGADHAAKGVGTKDGGAITAFAVTPTAVYYADADKNFQKAKLGDADPTWLARNLSNVTSMVLDQTSVYLASGCNVVKSAL